MPARTDYALRAVLSLARTQEWSSSQAIAADQQIPQAFLEHILTDLRRAGVVTSRRGGRGGYRLRVPPELLDLSVVVNAVDPDFLRRPDSAAAGSAGSAGSGGRAVDELWSALESAVQGFFEQLTVAELVEPGRDAGPSNPFSSVQWLPGDPGQAQRASCLLTGAKKVGSEG